MNRFIRCASTCLLVTVVFCSTALSSVFSHAKPSHICTQLQSAFKSRQILLIGVLNNHLFLLANGSIPFVYSIPMTRIKPLAFDLTSVVPKKLSRKLAAKNVAKFKSHVINANTKGSLLLHIGATDRMIFIAGFDSSTGIQTWDFELKPSQNVSQNSYQIQNVDLTRTMWVSSSEPSIFYLLSQSNFQSVTNFVMIKYKVEEPATFNQLMSLMMCRINGSSIQVQFMEINNHTYICDSPIFGCNLTEFRAFADKKNFYMFAPDDVYIFPVQAFQQPGTPASLTKLQYSNLLVCPDPTISAITTKADSFFYEKTTAASSESAAVIVAIIMVFIIVILVGIALWYFFCDQEDDVPSKAGDNMAKQNLLNNQANLNASSDDATKKDGDSSSLCPGGSNAGKSSTKFVTSSAKRNPGLKTKKKSGRVVGNSSSTRAVGRFSVRTGGGLKNQKTSSNKQKGNCKNSSVSKRACNSSSKK